MIAINFLLKQWKLILIVVLTIIVFIFFSNYRTLKSENVRLNSNVSVLNNNFESYKVAYNTGAKKINGKDSIINLNAAKVASLNYTIDEFKKYSKSDAQTISNLNLKIKNIQSVANVGTQTTSTIKTKIQYVDSIKCLNYTDKWNTVSGCFNGDSIDLIVETKDSLTVVASRIPAHHFLWWSWGIKSIQLDIVAQNPNTTFNYLKYIELKK